MYSLLPALVSALFLGYGLYVVAEKGFNRISGSFFLLCITTFFWQATWAMLFQVREPGLALILAKFGYLLIIFLPTALYHFLAEISRRHNEMRRVYFSYGIAAVLAACDLGTGWFVDGLYQYFWGFYPKAGILHPIHVLQTSVVVLRGLYISYQQQKTAPPNRRVQLRICIASLFIYFFAAVDYLCNYGFEFYPPGVVFTTISLGLIAVAVTRYDLMSPVSVAATVAHEMRTPLATIRLQAESLAMHLPELQKGYRLAVENGLCEDRISPAVERRLNELSSAIRHQVDRSNAVIDIMLASVRMEQIDRSTFGRQSAAECVAEALGSYPFNRGERERVNMVVTEDFEFHGSRPLMVYVLYNLLKNSLYALKAAGKPATAEDITFTVSAVDEGQRRGIGRNIGNGHGNNRGMGQTITVRDTGTGISAVTLPRIFETYFTTKELAGAGIGLAFCMRVMSSFDGRMRCDSVEGQFTTFTMEFPVLPALAVPATSLRTGPAAA
ncbi:MAG: sensor histidine kinase [Comamonadaceae bacterium]|nr:MAG: sensor histidine kinase [Comamonadaceae bacterium]